MINRVIVIGRLVRDPEMKKLQNGTSIVNFTVACQRNIKNAQGQQESDFLPCFAFSKVAEAVAKYTHKGSLIGVDGRIQTRSYDGKDGKKVFITEINCENVQFLESQPKQQTQSTNGLTHDDHGYYADNEIDVSNDELPF